MSVRDSLIFTILIFVLFGAFLLISLDDKGLVNLLEQSRTLAKVQAENRKVEDENAELCRSIERLRNDMDYVESVARRDLGMVGKEEMVLRFKKGAQAPAGGGASSLTRAEGPPQSP